jgi:hypothetical protein
MAVVAVGCGGASSRDGSQPQAQATVSSALKGDLSGDDSSDDGSDDSSDDDHHSAPPPLTPAGDCGVTLVATVTHHPDTRADGAARLAEPLSFSIPGTVALSAGSPRNVEAKLTYALGSRHPVTCSYRLHGAGAALALQKCDGHVAAGTPAVADTFDLSIQDADVGGDSRGSQVQITLALDRADGTACDDHNASTTNDSCHAGVCKGTAVCTSPAWSDAADMSVSRGGAAAVALASGDVLVTGGLSVSTSGASDLSSCEIFHEATGTWSPAAPMLVPRQFHTATRLADGRVMVMGGFSIPTSGSAGPLAETETMDPTAGGWSAAAPLPAAMYLHTATLMKSGDVLVVGSDAGTGAVAAFVYGTGGNTWSRVAAPAQLGGLYGAAVLLNDGRVLVAGGVTSSGAPSAPTLFDPVAQAWTATAPMPAARTAAGVALLPDGNVLIAGGADATGAAMADAFIYDVSNDTWSAAGSMSAARAQATVAVLPGGGIALAGGGASLSESQTVSGADYYFAGGWTAVASSTSAGFAAAAPLPSGDVLIVGGFTSAGGTALSRAQRFGCAP